MQDQLYTDENGTTLDRTTVDQVPPKKPKKEKKEKLALPAALSKFQKFSMVQVHRNQLINAPYNPRFIDEKSKKKLKDNLKRVGLVEPIIWNKTTGNIVGGHQRIAAIDSLEKTEDYLIEVAQVEMDDRTEKEQNIFLNNGEAQGGWDLAKLESLYTVDKLDHENTGFDLGNIYQMFGSNVMEESSVEEMEKAAEKLRDAYTMMEKSSQKDDDNDEADAGFYSVVVFKSWDERLQFHEALGLTDNKFVDGKFLAGKLGNLSSEYAEE